MQHIEEDGNGRVTRNDTRCGEPPELMREKPNEQRAQEERRQRNTDHGKHRNGVIDHAVLARGGFDAERNGDEELENGRNERDHKRNPHVLRDNLPDGLLVFERHAQIAL